MLLSPAVLTLLVDWDQYFTVLITQSLVITPAQFSIEQDTGISHISYDLDLRLIDLILISEILCLGLRHPPPGRFMLMTTHRLVLGRYVQVLLPDFVVDFHAFHPRDARLLLALLFFDHGFWGPDPWEMSLPHGFSRQFPCRFMLMMITFDLSLGTIRFIQPTILPHFVIEFHALSHECRFILLFALLFLLHHGLLGSLDFWLFLFLHGHLACVRASSTLLTLHGQSPQSHTHWSESLHCRTIGSCGVVVDILQNNLLQSQLTSHTLQEYSRASFTKLERIISLAFILHIQRTSGVGMSFKICGTSAVLPSHTHQESLTRS